jgi:hypothetical protein
VNGIARHHHILPIRVNHSHSHAAGRAGTSSSCGIPRSGPQTAVTSTIVNVGVYPGTKRLARALFAPEQIPDVLEVLGWYDDVQADDVRRAVLTLSKGDMNALLNVVAAAVDDFRDVLMWASLPEPTPEEREAARARAAELISQYREARHRHLVGRFGVKGAEQIERSNDKLFGHPPPKDHE